MTNIPSSARDAQGRVLRPGHQVRVFLGSRPHLATVVSRATFPAPRVPFPTVIIRPASPGAAFLLVAARRVTRRD